MAKMTKRQITDELDRRGVEYPAGKGVAFYRDMLEGHPAPPNGGPPPVPGPMAPEDQERKAAAIQAALEGVDGLLVQVVPDGPPGELRVHVLNLGAVNDLMQPAVLAVALKAAKERFSL